MELFLQVMMLLAGSGLVAGSEHGALHAEEHQDNHIPRFTVPSALPTVSGSFALKWTSPDSLVSPRFELQQGFRPDFSSARVIYTGPDRGTYISGLPNGKFFYRIRMLTEKEPARGPWSSTIHRTVRHPSLAFAFSLMSVGAMVFLGTIAMIVWGFQREKKA